MEAKLQPQIAFFLTGRRDDVALIPMNGRFRPALLSRFADLSTLRYDFPLVLNRGSSPERAVLSLSRMVDDAMATLAESPDRDRIGRHAFRLEREIRSDLRAGPADLHSLWNAAAKRLADDSDTSVLDSAKRLWDAFHADGELADVDKALPARVVRHAWNATQTAKAKSFRERASRLLFKLRGILDAEQIGSTAGRAPDRLKAGVGSSFVGAFDFDVMSRLLVEAKPATTLSDSRRARIQGLIDVLERQRFYPLGDAPAYEFAFDRGSDALHAYQARHEEAIELVKTLAMAELEANGDYREATHDVLFEGFGANGLDSSELAELPDYLVCLDGHSLDAAEVAQIVELLAAGVPIKVLVQTDDVLEPSVVAEGHVALGLRARQLVDTAIGLADVFVLQAAASRLFAMRSFLTGGMAFEGPALFSVFSGVGGHTGSIPSYLVAAAAVEARVFPSLVYNPAAGPDWASRLVVDDNPRAADDWPVHRFEYEGDRIQAQAEEVPFTLADFIAMDDRFYRHFAIVPPANYNDGMVPVPAALDSAAKSIPTEVPAILMVDDDGKLQRAIMDDRTILEVRRCRTMWHSLQELGGIHNSHAERLLAQERAKAVAVVTVAAPVAEAVAAPVATPAAAPAPEAVAPEPAKEESHGDGPYIETERCTSCNECTQVNNKMFQYNENKQAFIADPDAGTFRQLVEAAEGCQVSIIHPGKPRNPKEPGLEDLIQRAAPFN